MAPLSFSPGLNDVQLTSSSSHLSGEWQGLKEEELVQVGQGPTEVSVGGDLAPPGHTLGGCSPGHTLGAYLK